MNKRKLVEYDFKRLYNLSEDTHNIFTPFELCEEMLNKIPELNKDMKILVMFNLEFVYVLLEKFGRQNMSNIWFMTPCEKKGLIGKAMGLEENQINIYSYKDNKIEGEENMSKFDVVVGNPPYQANNNSGTESLWKKFIKLSFDKLLKVDGYICFITPIGWVADVKSRKYFLDKKVIYVNVKDSIKNNYFPKIGSTFSWFIIKNSNTNNILPIDLNDGFVNIDTLEFKSLPAKDLNSKTLSIYKKIILNTPKIKVINDNKFRIKNNTKTEKFKFPAFYTHSQQLVYTEFPRYIDVKKVIFSECGTFMPFYDDGKLGCVWHGCHIPVNNNKEGQNLIKFLNSKIIRFIEKISRTSAWCSFSHEIPQIDFSQEWTNEKLYKHFNLTQEEIDYIESQIK